MKVVLTRDVKNVGRAHEAIEAKDGYALNFLIPKKLAIPATPSALKEAEMRRTQATQKGAVDAALFTQSVASLAESKIVIKAKVNEKGHLYDAVNESDIRAAVQAQARIELPEGVIQLEKPLKEVGTFEIPLVSGETTGTLSLTIEAE